MSGGVVRFGDYTFPVTLAEFSDNFANVEPQAANLPGMDGGFNLDGDGAAVTAIGKVTVGFTLIADTREEMDAKRDAVKALVEKGVQQLVKQPTNTADATRYCLARVNFINMNERKDQQTDLWQKVQIIFRVDEPRWKSAPAGTWQLGDGSQIGDAGLEIGSGGEVVAASGINSSTNLVNNGTATAIAQVVVSPGAGQSAEDVEIERVVGALVVDSFKWEGTLSAGDVLSVDGRTQRATVNGASIWGAAFSYTHPDFLRIAPGTNTINIRMKNAGDAATVRVYFYDEYR